MAFLDKTIFKELRSLQLNKKLAAASQIVTFVFVFSKNIIFAIPVVAVAPISPWAQPLLSKPGLDVRSRGSMGQNTSALCEGRAPMSTFIPLARVLVFGIQERHKSQF